jgi:hypothetical protein
LIDPAVAVQLFKTRLTEISGGTPDEVAQFSEEHVPRIRQNIEASQAKSGPSKKAGQGEVEEKKGGGKKSPGGGGALKNKRVETAEEEKSSGSGGEDAGGDKHPEKRVFRGTKSEEPCLGHLGYLLGVYKYVCRFGTGCGFTHKELSEVSKVSALASLSVSKTTPDKLVELFKKEIEEKLL